MKNNNLRVLVTGSEGFIGKHLCTALEKHPNVSYVSHFDVDGNTLKNIENLVDTAAMMRECQPDIIFHLAAITEVKYNIATAACIISTNVGGTLNLLKYCPKGCRFVLASSVHCAYNQSVYSASKLGAEALVHAYSDMGLVEGVVLRLTSVVGKRMTHGVVKDIVCKLHSDSKELVILGEAPGSTRPYVYIDDAVNAFIHFGIDRRQCYNYHHHYITPADEVRSVISINEVTDIIMETISVYKPKRWLGKESKWLGDIDDIRVPRAYGLDSGWEPKYTSQQAIAKAVKDNME